MRKKRCACWDDERDPLRCACCGAVTCAECGGVIEDAAGVEREDEDELYSD